MERLEVSLGLGAVCGLSTTLSSKSDRHRFEFFELLGQLELQTADNTLEGTQPRTPKHPIQATLMPKTL